MHGKGNHPKMALLCLISGYWIIIICPGGCYKDKFGEDNPVVNGAQLICPRIFRTLTWANYKDLASH